MKIKFSLLLASALSLQIGAWAQCSKCSASKMSWECLTSKVDSMAHKVVSSGFNAGDSYGEVWIRDYNTFIELSMNVMSDEAVRQNLNTFFDFQGETGDIVDGFIPIEAAELDKPGGYVYRHSKSDLNHVAHKNTVETDHESSLINAIYRYVNKSGNRAYLDEVVAGKSVADRMESALEWLYSDKFNKKYGLIIGATTADWGDVQPEHAWGVAIDENTHYAIDIYDNALLVIALDNFIELFEGTRDLSIWKSRVASLRKSIRKHLWDKKQQKFIAHIYLDGSPFSDDLDEDAIYYHGGTAVAIQAALLSKEEVKISYQKMVANMEAADAQTIGLTLYPAYPAGSFMGAGMGPYSYQNGGDWTWFGARMINALLMYDLVDEAKEALRPMLERVITNNGFYEWYTPAGEPKGSGTFRGEAGVLYSAINALKAWEDENR